MIHLIKSIRKPRVIESSRRRRWLIACPTSGRQATILSILLILSKNLRDLGVLAVQIQNSIYNERETGKIRKIRQSTK